MPAATTQISFLFVLLSFAACGSSSSPAPSSTATPSPSTTTSPLPSSTTTTTTTTTTAGCVATNTVTIENFAFNPNCIQVSPANGNVTFTNQDSATHTATSDSGAAETFDSGNLATGASFTHKFQTAGATITGTCTIHPFMTFKVVVDAN